MHGYNWLFFTVQLVSIGSQSNDVSETEPILSQPSNAGSSNDPVSLYEIRPVNDDDDDDCQNIDADERCNIVNVEQPQRRICLDTEGEDLIAPCYCKGTQKYVHRSCLDNWISTKEGFAFSHCTECRAVFLLRANVPPDRLWLRLKFQLLVVRDHVLIFIIVQLVVVILGMLVYRFYGEELREMFGYEQHPYEFYSMAKIWCSEIACGTIYSVLRLPVTMIQEYIVESRDDDKKLPELDPSHVTELRNLGLY